MLPRTCFLALKDSADGKAKGEFTLANAGESFEQQEDLEFG